MKTKAAFVSALVVALVGILFARFESASAVDCEGTTETCGWFSAPTQIDANPDNSFTAEVTWDWYIAGNHSDVGTVIVEWDVLDPNNNNILSANLEPDFIIATKSQCSGPLESTLTGFLDEAGGGDVVLHGVVNHHTSEICQKDKVIDILD